MIDLGQNHALVGLNRERVRVVEERDEAAVHAGWPGAHWMPWDEPPVGALARRPFMEGDDGLCRVVGRYAAPPPRPAHDCPSCACLVEAPSFFGAWIVKRVRASGVDRDPDGNHILEWPPALRPVEEVKT